MKKIMQGIILATTIAFTTPLFAGTACPPHPNLKDCETEVNTMYTSCSKTAKANIDHRLGTMNPQPSQDVINSMYHEGLAPCSQEHTSGINHCRATCKE